jgi:hypothetical protein
LKTSDTTQLNAWEKFEILYAILKGKNLGNFIDKMDKNQYLKFCQFLWETTIEMGIRTQGPQFLKKDKILFDKKISKLIAAKDYILSSTKNKKPKHPELKQEINTIAKRLQQYMMIKPSDSSPSNNISRVK